MDLVNQPVEFVEERLLLSFKILELLEADLVLPLDLLDRTFILEDFFLSLRQLADYLVVANLLLRQLVDKFLVSL